MLLSLSYILHLIATVIWLGGLFVLALLAWTAQRGEADGRELWVRLQRLLLPWIQVSLIVLLVTGFYQMTVDPNYGGFLAIDGVWGWALLLKHLAYAGLVGTTVYWQFILLPELERLQLLSKQSDKKIMVEKKEKRLLIVNCFLALIVLIFTGIMTAV